MNRTEFVRRLALMEISDDFENVDQVILRHVAERGSRCGLKIARSEIVDALAGLIEDGLAKAYDLSAAGTKDPFSTEIQGMPEINLVEENFKTYFYITRRGWISTWPAIRGGRSTTRTICGGTGA